MDLQIALIAFGIAIICVVYWLSVRREKLNAVDDSDVAATEDRAFDATTSSQRTVQKSGFIPDQYANQAFGQAPNMMAHDDEEDQQVALSADWDHDFQAPNAPEISLSSQTDELSTEDKAIPSFVYEQMNEQDIDRNIQLERDIDSDQVTLQVAQEDVEAMHAAQQSYRPQDVADELEQTAKLLVDKEDGESNDIADVSDSAALAKEDFAPKQNTQPIDNQKYKLEDKIEDKLEYQPQHESDVITTKQSVQERSGSGGSEKSISSSDTASAISGISSSQAKAAAYKAPEGFEKISQIDYWVKLEGARDVGRESVLGVFRQHSNQFSVPVRIYGLRKHDNIWAEVEQEAEGMRFQGLVVTLQLVTATSEANSEQLQQFSDLVEELSIKTGRTFRFMAPVDSALQQAQFLAQFRDTYDKVYLLNIKPLEGNQFGGAAVDRCATQLGLDRGLHHFVRHKLIGRKKVKVYSVANHSDTGEFDFTDIGVDIIKGVTFFTQPAVNKSPGAIYAEMLDAAKSFASRVKGELMMPYADLSIDEVDKVRREIDAMAKKMQEDGIAPGSEEAIRIFSS